MSASEATVDSSPKSAEPAAAAAAIPADDTPAGNIVTKKAGSEVEMASKMSNLPSTDIEATLFDDGTDYSSIR